LLRIREKLSFREEAFHLVLAGGVGVIGGLVNLAFFYATETVMLIFMRRQGDPVQIAQAMGALERVAVPTIGALAAGLILFWWLRVVGQQGDSNRLVVVVAGDGRLPLRPAIV
jgi:CIC family chloride channel protein